MGCTTFYAVREGTEWVFGLEDNGLVDLTAPSVARSLVGQTMTVACPACRGLLVDSVRRVLRFHSCHEQVCHPVARAWERSVQGAPQWVGWDVGFAWGGHAELAEMLGQPAAPPEPAEVVQPSLDARHCRYDAAAHRLDYDEEALQIAQFLERPALVTVIAVDGRSRHHAVLALAEEALGLLARGPKLADAVAEFPVWPSVDEDVEQGWGIVVDRQRREVGFWGIPCTPGQVAELRRRHGWRFVRLTEGYADQLARSGVEPGPRCVGAGLPWPRGTRAQGCRPMPAVRPGVEACRSVAHTTESGAASS